MKIDKIEIPNKVVLAPMAGITDLPYRKICKKFGAGLVVTEMISAKALLYENVKTCLLLQIDDSEFPVATQLFGSDPEILGSMAKQVSEGDTNFIDLNMGCPAPKITKNGEGSALMQDPELVYRIVQKVVECSKKPVTVKIRKGYEEDNALEVALAIESAQASAITVHGRTRDQFYSGKADWDIIRKVKSKLSIPVIGNGDIRTPLDAEKMLAETGCDAVMIGRAAMGNPWILKRTVEYLETGELLSEPSISERIDVILKHAQDLIEFKGEYIGIREMRAHLSCYIRSLPNAAKLRYKLNTTTSLSEMQADRKSVV